ncbi:hypothetical protein [Dyadobacter psychrotolerans]|uniref:Uncharacterized protein n=1 Tax=Dyadobacter psychrotolerans TaxID=2541721 RepID=A0A4R5DX66_9BACT|nr:hypothetical protein [Dyadobacter psychrotolerans]TDE15673.1 hypothetical protein E0F88_14340 [Dyadobacter psychrotolerans]
MPEFKFYICDDERRDLVNQLITKGTKVIPDLMYDIANYRTLKNGNELFNHLQNNEVGFLLLDTRFEVEPLAVSKNRFSEEPKYSIYQRKGGPYINISFYTGYANEALFPYKCSIVEHYSHYIHSDSSIEYGSPDGLNEFYKDLITLIKKQCAIVKKDGKNFWVGKQVLDMDPELKHW